MKTRFTNHLALLVLATLVFMPSASHAAQSVSLDCSPAAGKTVMPGDTISYTLSIGRDEASSEWTALRIHLGDGMLILTESISVTSAGLPEETQPDQHVSPKPSDDAQALSTPAQPVFEVVPGNDGFVVLFSSMQEGDVIAFDARVDSEQADVRVQAQTNAFTISTAHELGKLPVASAVPIEAAPSVQAQSKGFNAKPLRLVLVLLCIFEIIMICFYALKKYNQKLWEKICFPWKWPQWLCSKLPEKVRVLFARKGETNEKPPVEVEAKPETTEGTAEAKTTDT